jgi:hypothetical protein
MKNDKIFIKSDEKRGLGDNHPHWTLFIVILIYIVCLLTSLFIIIKSIIPFFLVLSVGSLITVYYIVKKLSYEKASGLIGFVKRDNVLYAIRLYANYSEAGEYIPIPPSMTSLVIATMPNNINYAKKSIAIEKNIDKLSKNRNFYVLILENLLADIKNKNKDKFYVDMNDYKLDMFLNKYGFKRYIPGLSSEYYCGYIIMNDPKIVRSNNKWFEISFIDEQNNSKIMRFKNVYDGLVDELK